MNDGRVAETYVRIAAAKSELDPFTAFFRGVLCNVLVCLAVWMAMAGRSVVDKVVVIVFPVTLFVAAGFEHSIANMYLIPMGLLLADPFAAAGMSVPTVGGMFANLLPVIAGNLVGGSVLVALVYFLAYRAGEKQGN
jgi:formate transporter